MKDFANIRKDSRLFNTSGYKYNQRWDLRPSGGSKNIADVLSHENIEVLFVYISTYALSSTVLPLAQRLKVPIILLNIQPSSHIDYTYINSLGDRGLMTGEWLANCQACSVPEFANILIRSDLPLRS